MIHLTPAALKEIQRLQSKHLNQYKSFRLSVLSGGCSGFYYQMGLDETTQVGDGVYEIGGIEVIIAQESVPFVKGLEIDYSEDLMGGAFRFQNPNATQSCSCGNSFSL